MKRTPPRRRSRRVAVWVACLPLTLGVASAAPITFDTVAVSGDVAPDTVGETFVAFELPKVSSGTVAFAARTSGSTLQSDWENGVWIGAGGSLSGFEVHPDHRAVLHGYGGGTAAFTSGPLVAGGGTLWSAGSGGASPIATPGNPAPDIPGATISSIFEPGSSGERTAFGAFLNGSGVTSANDYALYSHESGTLTLLARKGEPGPLPDSIPRFVSTDTGGSAFVPFLPGVSTIGTSIWSDVGGTLEKVYGPGDPAPTGAGATFTSFGDPSVGSDGMAFHGGTTGGTGIFSRNAGGLELVARAGEPAPGLGSSTFDFQQLSLSLPDYDAGRTVLRTSTGPSTTGIWSHEAGGALELIARTGDVAPGTGGARFTAFGRPMTDGGRLAFAATLNECCGNKRMGLFAEDPLGNLTLVAREGELIEVAPGDVRRIFDLGAELDANPSNHSAVGSGTGTGRTADPQGFADGRMAFRARFDDGSAAVLLATIGTQEQTSVAAQTDLTTAFMAASDPSSGIQFTFDEITQGGSLTVTQTSAVPAALETGSSAFVFDAFATPIVYDVTFDGAFTPGVDIVLRYDEAALLIPEADLVVYHLTSSGDLVALATTVHADQDFVTARTPGFSGLVLGATAPGAAAVSEPAVPGLVVAGLLAAALCRRRRRAGVPPARASRKLPGSANDRLLSSRGKR